MILPKFTENNVFKSRQTFLILPTIGVCPINYWIEEEVEIEKKNSLKAGFLKKLALVGLGIFFGAVFVNLKIYQ